MSSTATVAWSPPTRKTVNTMNAIAKAPAAAAAIANACQLRKPNPRMAVGDGVGGDSG
jgi:hypothetical protein